MTHARCGALNVPLLLFLIAGCTSLGAGNQHQPYPQAQHPRTAYQDKLQAIQHWETLARNEAKLLAQAIPPGSIIWLNEKKGETSFGSAYRKLLAQHVLAQGLRVSLSRAEADYVLDYEVQVVVHRDRDALRPPAGAFLATGTSAWLIYQAAHHWEKSGLVAIPLAAAADIYLASNRDAPTPNTEVLITTSLYQGNELVRASNRIYYFNSGDTNLYAGNRVPARAMRVTDMP